MDILILEITLSPKKSSPSFPHLQNKFRWEQVYSNDSFHPKLDYDYQIAGKYLQVFLFFLPISRSQIPIRHLNTRVA